MQREMLVFREEREAGLEAAIRANSSVAYASAVRLAELPEASEKALAKLASMALMMERARSSKGDFDLHPLTTVLVTTGWNLNDDVFDPVETWVARRTPEDKQLNYEHDDAQIVGHITTNWVIDADGKAVADDIAPDDLPAKFHVVTGGVLYKYWQKAELQQRMDAILADIAKGEMFVSMECLFQGFDYAMLAGDGSTKVVARNDQTAFLSKHLRCYGGSGKYGDYQVGRLLRNICFSGKGLVKNPANPESVIFAQARAFSAGRCEIVNNFSRLCATQVYPPVTAKGNNQESTNVAIELETLQKQLAELRTENERLKASQQETQVAELRAKLEKAEAEKAKADELLKAADEAMKAERSKTEAAAKDLADARAKLAESEKTVAEVKQELSDLYKEQRTKARVASVKDKLKMGDDDAAEFVTTNEHLAEEAFAKQVELLAKTIAKQAPAQAAVTETNTAEEADAAGETAAEQTSLEGAEKTAAAAALSTVEADSGVNDVAQAIAAYFGADVSDEQD